MAKIYLASSWRNKYQQNAVQLLEKYGHEVYDFKHPAPDHKGFDWAEIDPYWKQWEPAQYIESLSHPVAERGFNFDFDAMKWADTCVLLLPCGRSAHTEAGWMKGAGKRVYAVMIDDNEPELMYKLFDKVFDGLLNCIQYLTDLHPQIELLNALRLRAERCMIVDDDYEETMTKIREKVMSIYRKFPDLINKRDLVLFGIARRDGFIKDFHDLVERLNTKP